METGECKQIVQGYSQMIYLLKLGQEFWVLLIRKPKYHGTKL